MRPARRHRHRARAPSRREHRATRHQRRSAHPRRALPRRPRPAPYTTIRLRSPNRDPRRPHASGWIRGAGFTIRTTPSSGGITVNTALVTSAETDLTTANNSAQTSTAIRVPITPTLTGVTITNSQTKFTLTGDAGMSYKILASTNLTTWTALATNTAALNGTIKFTDTAATNYTSRYYRAERVIP